MKSPIICIFVKILDIFPVYAIIFLITLLKNRIYEREVTIMAYCKNCGSVLEDGATFCTSCGSSQGPAPVTDNGGFGWNLCGFCAPPIVTLILYLVWKDSKPKTAQAICHGALFNVILSIVFYLIAMVLGYADYYM